MKTYTLRKPRKPRSAQECLAVKVAKDVVLQLKLGKYRASAGTYIQTISYDRLENVDQQCHVCAIGAAWLSHNRVTGHEDVTYLSGDCMVDDLDSSLNGYARLMESAFEGYRHSSIKEDDEAFECGYGPVHVAAGKWRSKFLSSTVRMRRIMNNLIRNGGVFKIEEVR